VSGHPQVTVQGNNFLVNSTGPFVAFDSSQGTTIPTCTIVSPASTCNIPFYWRARQPDTGDLTFRRDGVFWFSAPASEVNGTRVDLNVGTAGTVVEVYASLFQKCDLPQSQEGNPECPNTNGVRQPVARLFASGHRN
jgi:hypothetical protein